jgi:hypothetical protein
VFAHAQIFAGGLTRQSHETSARVDPQPGRAIDVVE